MRTPKGRWAHGLGRREADGSDAGLTRSRARGPVQGTDRGWGQRGPNHTHSHLNMAVTYPNDVRQDKGAAEGRWVPSRRVPSPAPRHVAHGAEPRAPASPAAQPLPLLPLRLRGLLCGVRPGPRLPGHLRTRLVSFPSSHIHQQED